MGRRRKSGFEELLTLPWQAQLVFAGIAAFMALIVPAVAPRNAVLLPLVELVRQFAWYAALGLLALAATSYVVKRFKRKDNELLRIQSSGQRQEPSFSAPHANLEPTALDAAWEASIKPLAIPKPDQPKPDKWSLELLRELEWKRFEIVCAAYYASRGFRVETIRCGADGGIDAKLFFKDLPNPVAIIQCKAWNNRPVGVKPVRELLGVMAHNKVAKGIFQATGQYTNDAIDFAKANKIALISGADFIEGIGELPEMAQKELLNKAIEGDYTTPTCPACGVKMVTRTSDRGDFWGCPSYPRCRQTFHLRSAG